MKNPVDVTGLCLSSELRGDDPQETQELRELVKCAEQYLASFSWCGSIKKSYVGIAEAGIVGLFLFQIDPAQPEVDEWLWVVVGDVPPVYLVTDNAPDPESALLAYIAEMRAWADAVESGDPVDDLIPVNVPPTKKYGDMLKVRLDFLVSNLLGQDT
jgi:hypothetical protein